MPFISILTNQQNCKAEYGEYNQKRKNGAEISAPPSQYLKGLI